MKITFFIEIDNVPDGKGWPAWKPGYFKGVLNHGWFRRVWWGWFAIGSVTMNLYEWNRYVESGKTEWRFK